jgi:hypothetical protein
MMALRFGFCRQLQVTSFPKSITHHEKKRKAESGKPDLITGWKVINKRWLGESWNELGVLDTEIPRLRLEEGMVGKRGMGSSARSHIVNCGVMGGMGEAKMGCDLEGD